MGARVADSLDVVGGWTYYGRMYWRSILATQIEIDPALVEYEPTAMWLLLLITGILIAGFVGVILLTKRPKGPGRMAPPKPPHPRGSSWWNP